MKPLLEVRDLVVGYSADIDILQSVSLQVLPATITGLIGLNGAGKSTLMKAIYGFLKPKKGRVFLEEEEITGIAPHDLLHKGVWYIPQESSLFPFLSVEDNLRLVASRLDHIDVRERFEEVFARFPDLFEKRKERTGNLSGGQQKMVEAAKALLVRPKLLLVDEPTVGLAPRVAEFIYEKIALFQQEGMSILLVDHNVRQVITLSHYIYVLSLGKIVAEGPQEQFQAELKHQVKQWLGL